MGPLLGICQYIVVGTPWQGRREYRFRKQEKEAEAPTEGSAFRFFENVFQCQSEVIDLAGCIHTTEADAHGAGTLGPQSGMCERSAMQTGAYTDIGAVERLRNAIGCGAVGGEGTKTAATSPEPLNAWEAGKTVMES